jgi:hypothetical protein
MGNLLTMNRVILHGYQVWYFAKQSLRLQQEARPELAINGLVLLFLCPLRRA